MSSTLGVMIGESQGSKAYACGSCRFVAHGGKRRGRNSGDPVRLDRGGVVFDQRQRRPHGHYLYGLVFVAYLRDLLQAGPHRGSVLMYYTTVVGGVC